MALSISAVVLLAIIVFLLIRKSGLKGGHAVVCILLGFYLASSTGASLCGGSRPLRCGVALRAALYGANARGRGDTGRVAPATGRRGALVSRRAPRGVGFAAVSGGRHGVWLRCPVGVTGFCCGVQWAS